VASDCESDVHLPQVGSGAGEVFHKVRYTDGPFEVSGPILWVMAEKREFPGWVRHSGAGIELAGATAGLALFGYWIDGKFGTAPWGIVIGVVMGLVGGLYNLVRDSLKAVREAQAEDREKAGATDDPQGRRD